MRFVLEGGSRGGACVSAPRSRVTHSASGKKKRGSEEWERWTRAKRSTENKVFKPRLQIATAERIVAHARAKYLPSIHKPRSAAAGLSDRQPERSR